jgi:hypothetical protein
VKGHHIFDITARPRLLPVTESIALPPRPKAVNMSNIDKFSIREWLVPPILLPIFLALLVAAAMFIQWSPPWRTSAIGSDKQLVCRGETNLVIGS